MPIEQKLLEQKLRGVLKIVPCSDTDIQEQFRDMTCEPVVFYEDYKRFYLYVKKDLYYLCFSGSTKESFDKVSIEGAVEKTNLAPCQFMLNEISRSEELELSTLKQKIRQIFSSGETNIKSSRITNPCKRTTPPQSRRAQKRAVLERLGIIPTTKVR